MNTVVVLICILIYSIKGNKYEQDQKNRTRHNKTKKYCTTLGKQTKNTVNKYVPRTVKLDKNYLCLLIVSIKTKR